jgi:hypothetical protein
MIYSFIFIFIFICLKLFLNKKIISYFFSNRLHLLNNQIYIKHLNKYSISYLHYLFYIFFILSYLKKIYKIYKISPFYYYIIMTSSPIILTLSIITLLTFTAYASSVKTVVDCITKNIIIKNDI